jgi:demethylmenaquinone methyltransferase/2-methoxy-6-polyprenyl-1,4-benzoquinol methylase
MSQKKRKYPLIKQMSSSQRIGMVRDIFSTIPQRYDFLNRFFSARRDLAWRRFVVKKMRFLKTNRFLDVATGTADLAIEAARKHSHIHATGLDFVRDMMTIGQQKLNRYHLSGRIRFIEGDALHLPFPNDCFDVSGIAFGIRNIPECLHALKEMTRVVVCGGQVMVLEMHFPRKRLLRSIYCLYLKHILPYTARLFSSNPSAYDYLADSIVHFPDPDRFAQLMEKVGLVHIEQHALTFGIAYLHIGIKPEATP